MSGAALRLQVILSALDRVTGPLKKAMGGSTALAKSLRATQGELKHLNDTQRQLEQFRTLKLGSQQAGTALETAKAKLHALSAEMRGADTVSRKLGAQHRAAKREVLALTEAHGRQQSKLNALRMTLDRAGVSTARLGQHERQLKTQIAQANAALDAQKTKLRTLHAAQQKMQRMHAAGMKLGAHGAGAIAAGTVAARGVGVPVGAFMAQEDAATKLRASMMDAGGKVGPEFAKIDALAQQLGNRLPGTTADFYDMMTMLQRQGMSAKTVLGGLGEATAYLGVQLGLGYTEAAEFAAKLQDATRTTEADMMSLSDVIQRTFYLGVDSDNMLQGFSKLTGSMDTLRISGLAASKVFAPLLVMADQAGMKGEAAGNAYRKVFQGAMDAGKMAKANALLKGTGVSLDFTNGKGEFGGLDQMFKQVDKLKGINTQDRLAAIKKMFGDDAETLQTVSLLIAKGSAGYAQVQGKMDAQASLQQRVNSQLGTLRNLWDAATGTFTNALAAMGAAVAPEMKALTEWLGKAAEKLQAWAQANPALAGGLLKIAAVMTTLIIAAGALALAVGAVMLPLAGINTAMAGLGLSVGGAMGKLKMLGGALRLIAPVLAGITAPAWVVVAAVLAIAAAAGLIWKYWEPIKAFFAGLWQGLSAAMAPVMAEMGAALAPLAPLWDMVAGAIGKVWGWIQQLFEPFKATSAQLQGATDNGRTFGAVLGKVLGVLMIPLRMLVAVVGWVASMIVKHWDTIVAIFNVTPLGMVISNWGAIKTYLSTLWEGIKAVVKGAWDFIAGIFTGDSGRITQGLLAIFNGISTMLGGWPARFLQWGKDMILGLINGITSMAGALRSAITGAVGGAVDRFKAFLGIRSPSRLFAQFGTYTMQGFAGGLDRSQSLPLRQITALGDRMRIAGAGLALGAAVLPAAAPTGGGAPRIDARAPLSARAAAAPAGRGDTYEIHIHAAAGANNDDLIKLLRAELARIERERGARQRSALSDYGD